MKKSVRMWLGGGSQGRSLNCQVGSCGNMGQNADSKFRARRRYEAHRVGISDLGHQHDVLVPLLRCGELPSVSVTFKAQAFATMVLPTQDLPVAQTFVIENYSARMRVTVQEHIENGLNVGVADRRGQIVAVLRPVSKEAGPV